MEHTMGRVTIPTDMDVVKETLELAKKWGADAVRDCDGTDFPKELKDAGLKVYATYYTTRKDNAWAKENPDEIQQMYLMTPIYTAEEEKLQIHLMKGLYPDMLAPNSRDDIKRWWEVVDRTTGEVVDTDAWEYDEAGGDVTIKTVPFHDYTVSFLAYILWDPVHMYNAVVNDWKDVEHQMTFDVRQPKTHAFTMKRLRKFIETHPYVNVLRFTTFFHQFTLVFDELAREKYVDWYGYSASVSPYILEQFEKEAGYRFRPEYIIDQGYYNNQYRIPTKEYKDFQAFQRREVAKIVKEMVDITHEYGKEAMMFLGDHWIGTEPFMGEFQGIGLDAVVGSVGNGATLRLISDIEGVKYTEGRLLPYFFPDTFHEGADPVKEAKTNWVTARRAILRKPIDRIGYGGYLKLTLDFPEFTDYVESVCEEFRELYRNIKGTTPYCVKTVAVLNCFGKMRAWGSHMVHHAIYFKQNYSYAGIMEALSGAPFDVRFISFEDILKTPDLLKEIDVILNVGDADTAESRPRIRQTDIFSSLRTCLAWRRSVDLRLDMTNTTKTYTRILSPRTQVHTLILARERKISTRLTGQRSWRRREMTSILPYMNLAQGARSTSAGCRSPLKTTDCFTGRFCGVREMKRTSTAGFPPTTMSKSTPMWQTENTAWSTIPMNRRRQRSIPEMAAIFRLH